MKKLHVGILVSHSNQRRLVAPIACDTNLDKRVLWSRLLVLLLVGGLDGGNYGLIKRSRLVTDGQVSLTLNLKTFVLRIHLIRES